MKTIAVIGANKPLEPFYQQILGKYRIIGIAWEEGAICKKYCDVFYPISFSDKERVLEVCKKEKIIFYKFSIRNWYASCCNRILSSSIPVQIFGNSLNDRF